MEEPAATWEFDRKASGADDGVPDPLTNLQPTEPEIYSLSDLALAVKQARNDASGRLILRGCNWPWPLRPSLDRHRYRLESEHDIELTRHIDPWSYLELLRDIVPQDGPLKGLGNAELLAAAEHYGLPTWLLNWSTSPVRALFFAVASEVSKHPHMPKWLKQQQQRDGAGSLWILDTGISPHRCLTSSEILDVSGANFTVVKADIPRISEQRGVFTCHRLYAQDDDERLPFVGSLERVEAIRAGVRWHRVPHAAFDHLRLALAERGITRERLMPSNDSLDEVFGSVKNRVDEYLSRGFDKMSE